MLLLFRSLLGFLVLALAASCSTDLPAAQQATAVQDLRVRKGEFRDIFLLSGELEAPEGAVVAVPALPSWQSSIRWLIDDGTEVAEGDPVAELDSSEFASSLETRHSAMSTAEHSLAQKRSELTAALAEKEYQVEKRKSDLEKASLQANVPEDLLSRREFEERRLGLERAQTEYDKALADLEAEKTKGIAELRNLEIELARARREVQIAENAIQTLTLRAPRAGIVVLGQNPWEERKLKEGDNVFVSMALAQIPDLSSLQVVGTLPDVDDGKIRPGMAVTLTIDAFPERTYRGTIADIAPVAQEIGRGSLRRGFRVVVPLETLDLERMRPGLSVLVEVERAAAKDVLIAPRAAIDIESRKARLANGREVEVDLGPCGAQECVVNAGLDERQALAPWRRSGGTA